MMFPLVRDLAGDGIPVTVTCRVLKLCRPQYYRWIAEPISDAEPDEAYLASAIFDAQRDDPELGYRFLADEGRATGLEVSDRVAWRICRDMGWSSVFGKPKARKASKPGTHLSPTPPTDRPRPPHPHRIRDDQHPNRHPGRLTRPVTTTRGSPMSSSRPSSTSTGSTTADSTPRSA
jgi:hypothetical protein